jgi:hypothetical protein
MLIRYNKKISMSYRDELPMFTTDTGQIWRTTTPYQGINNLNSWWENHRQDKLGHWQKDALVRNLANASESKIEFYNPYRVGHGFQEQPDLTVVKLVKSQIWIISTAEHTWLEPDTAGAGQQFITSRAMPPITDPAARDLIYQVECKLRGIPYRARINPQ